MKILHICSGGINGGAAKGALNLHFGLLKAGIDSRFLIQNGSLSGEDEIYSLNSSFFRIIERRAISLLGNNYKALLGVKTESIFSIGRFSQRSLSHPLFEWAELVNLHWVVGGMLSLSNISSIQKPIVWTIRDMWPMTGGCHYSLECKKYIDDCGNCPMLSLEKEEDVSRLYLYKKKIIYGNSNMYFVGISKWVTKCFRESRVSELVDSENISTIENCIDDSLFYPDGGALVRAQLGLPKTGKIILSGAVNNDIEYKGGKYLKEILEGLSKEPDATVVVFGDMKGKINGCLNVGRIFDSHVLRKYYSCADVFVMASVQEAFGKTVTESMACGTPVVAFGGSGPATIITDNEDGFIVENYNVEKFVSTVKEVLNLSNSNSMSLSKKCIEKVEEKFGPSVSAAHYVNLYEKILSRRRV